MTTYEIIKLNNLEEIEDRAIKGETICQEKLRSMAAPHPARLYDANYENMYFPDSRNPAERQRDHQEYEFALVVTEYIEQEPARYVIYKGDELECRRERNRFEESKRNLEGYRQNGNGTKRRYIR